MKSSLIVATVFILHVSCCLAATYNPKEAAVVFLPGLMASDIGCETPQSDTYGLWPGSAEASYSSLANWMTSAKYRFSSMALINQFSNNGSTLTSQTTGFSSVQTASGETVSICGNNGGFAANEPYPLNPAWCLPELETELDNPPAQCQLEVPSSGGNSGLANYTSEVYQPIAYQLQGNLTQQNRPFIKFAWDWRKFPTETMERLHQTISSQVQASGTKVTAVAHSYGNILFRAWMYYVRYTLNEMPGDYVGRFLSVAGPWWGTATSYEHPAFGSLQPTKSSNVLSALIGYDVVKEAFQSFPSSYWLFPTSQFDNYVNTYILDQNQNQTQHWLARENLANDFQSQWIPFSGVGASINETFTQCPQSEEYPCQPENIYNLRNQMISPYANGSLLFETFGIEDFVAVVGSGVETAVQICDGCMKWPEGSTAINSNSSVTVVDMTPVNGDAGGINLLRGISGDGNVAVFSAIQGNDPFDPPGEDIPFYFTCGIHHTALMQNQDVLDQTVPYLLGEIDEMQYGSAFSTTPCDIGSTVSSSVSTRAVKAEVKSNEKKAKEERLPLAVRQMDLEIESEYSSGVCLMVSHWVLYTVVVFLFVFM